MICLLLAATVWILEEITPKLAIPASVSSGLPDKANTYSPVFKISLSPNVIASVSNSGLTNNTATSVSLSKPINSAFKEILLSTR